MGTLEKIMQLKNQGQTEPQIAENLKQEGVAPKEIDEALSQSKIKSAVNEQGAMVQQSSQTLSPTQALQPSQSTQPTQTTSEPQKTTGSSQMQPSIMQQIPGTYSEVQQTQQPAKPIQEIPQSFQQSAMPMPQPEAPQPYQYSEYQYPEYQTQQIGDVETINEIAEQILDERTAQLKNQITSLIRFKDEITLETEKLNERLSKIEDILNELQTAILGKIGDYGKDIKNIAKEMHSTQDSFSKILNPLTDNIRELQKITSPATKSQPNRPKPEPSRPKPKTKSRKSKSRKKSKSKPSFEDYLR